MPVGGTPEQYPAQCFHPTATINLVKADNFCNLLQAQEVTRASYLSTRNPEMACLFHNFPSQVCSSTWSNRKEFDPYRKHLRLILYLIEVCRKLESSRPSSVYPRRQKGTPEAGSKVLSAAASISGRQLTILLP
jgi:hypothetical protein